MNLTNMETGDLVILWKTAAENWTLRAPIEAELKKRIPRNHVFSREFFFEKCIMNNHAITVSFIPTTASYKLYGPELTIKIILRDEELQEMIQNHSSIPPVNTAGELKAQVLVKDGLSEQQIESAKTKGFQTSEVFEH